MKKAILLPIILMCLWLLSACQSSDSAGSNGTPASSAAAASIQGHVVDGPIEECPDPRQIDEILGNRERRDGNVLFESSRGADGYDELCPLFLQCRHIGSVVHPVGWGPGGDAVPGYE